MALLYGRAGRLTAKTGGFSARAGAGNHYAEIQVVDEIFDAHAAAKMGVERLGQVCSHGR